jgi:hypothetical protein
MVAGKCNFSMSYNKQFKRTIWNYPLGDYVKLNNDFFQIPWEMVIDQSDNIDDAVEMLSDLILQSCKRCIPNKTVQIFPRDKPGMTTMLKHFSKRPVNCTK